MEQTEQKPDREFPKGWPIRCPDCDSCNFYYKSERSGNIRRYVCKKCNSMFMAEWNGEPISSVFSEPTNTRMEQWEWSKIIPPDFLSMDIKTETTVSTVQKPRTGLFSRFLS